MSRKRCIYNSSVECSGCEKCDDEPTAVSSK